MHKRLSGHSVLIAAGAAFPLLGVGAFSAHAQEVNVSRDMAHRYGETQIAVNPKNNNNIVYVDVKLAETIACAKAKNPDCEPVETRLAGMGIQMSQPRGFFTRRNDFSTVGMFYSFDHGKTWHTTTVPLPTKAHPQLTGWGDPSITATPDGTFYLSFDNMDWGTPENTLPDGGIGVSKSTDGGKTWSSPVLTGTPLDGPKIVSDPNTGMLYGASSTTLGPLSTADPDAPRGTLSTRWLVSSKDGVHWTKPQAMGGIAFTSAAHGVLAGVFKTGPKSMFGDANNELCGSAPAPCVLFETTKDAGATWDRHAVPAPTSSGAAMVAADPSKAGHFAVAVSMNGDKEFDVYQTRDSGVTWSKPERVATEDTAKRHTYPWMAYSPNGVLGMMWRTVQPAPPGQAVAAAPPSGGMSFGNAQPMPYNIWAVISRDGGTKFSAPLKVSKADSPAGAPGASGDDYSGLTLDRTHVYVGWPDWRPGERQAFFRAIPFTEFK